MVASSCPDAQVLLAKCVGVAAVSTYAQTPRPASATQCSQCYPTTLLISKRRAFLRSFIRQSSRVSKPSAHIAAILHLCRMMVKQCRDEGIPLVNIVKKEDRVVQGHWRRVCRELAPPIRRMGLLDSRETHSTHDEP